jgi:hypothetical protein
VKLWVKGGQATRLFAWRGRGAVNIAISHPGAGVSVPRHSLGLARSEIEALVKFGKSAASMGAAGLIPGLAPEVSRVAVKSTTVNPATMPQG